MKGLRIPSYPKYKHTLNLMKRPNYLSKYAGEINVTIHCRIPLSVQEARRENFIIDLPVNLKDPTSRILSAMSSLFMCFKTTRRPRYSIPPPKQNRKSNSQVSQPSINTLNLKKNTVLIKKSSQM